MVLAEKNRVFIFLLLTALPLLIYSSTPPLNIVNTEKEIVGSLTTGDLMLSISLLGALTTVWVFILRKRI